jgi:hypothetical protein
MKLNNISGGVDMYYQSTLVYELGKRLLRKSNRKEKIKRIWMM